MSTVPKSKTLSNEISSCFAVKRKKTEGTGDDSEQRPNLVLSVKFNKGTPISSTTKTKPVPADPPSEKALSSGE